MLISGDSIEVDDTNGAITVYARPVTASAVPEASTTVSFGLLLALGVCAMIVARKRTAAVKAD